MLILLLQTGVILIGISFLIFSWRDISRGAWLSFLVRDVLWLILTLDQIAGQKDNSLITGDIALIVQFSIVLLLFYSTIARYHFQRGHQEYRRNFAQRENDLEHFWNIRNRN